jgi:hypothetical protein
MSGIQAAQTIKVLGKVAQYSVQMLVDGGSTLNFIKTHVAHTLGLTHSPSPSLKVIVGNGDELTSNHVCKEVQIEIQGHKFVVDLYTLNLSGPDVVLGTPWLKTLGPILMDYETLTMQFSHGQQKVELKGENGPSMSSISYMQLKQLIQREPTTQIFSLRISSIENVPPPQSSTNIQRLLE